jgi:hypothetical protein
MGEAWGVGRIVRKYGPRANLLLNEFSPCE